MAIKNKIMLITYADSLGKNLKELSFVIKKHFAEAIESVHILPFYPSSADRGFAPKTYSHVDPIFGDWGDIEEIAKTNPLMFDFMVNHISRSSEYFKDFLLKKDKSQYAGLFLRYKDFWPSGEPSTSEVDLIYKRKPRAPYVDAIFADGTTEKVWCTFDEEQIDLNPFSKETKAFFEENLVELVKRGASLIRLDAFAYAIKKPGTNCFFLEPEIWELLESLKSIVDGYGAEVLPEIHEHYTMQLKIAEKGYWVYDFALPMLVLHALYSGKSERLAHWLKICPRKQFTTLDTHDGIGVVDAYDLLTEDEIELTKDLLYSKGANVKKIYSSMAYDNLDIYQINCTYYSALGDNDEAYLLARAIQFFAPGVPQVYYVGLLAGANDIELLETTKVGRDINRHFYSIEEVETNFQRTIVKRLHKLMVFRNTCQAFDGSVEVSADENILTITRNGSGGDKAVLYANLKNHDFKVFYEKYSGESEEISFKKTDKKIYGIIF